MESGFGQLKTYKFRVKGQSSPCLQGMEGVWCLKHDPVSWGQQETPEMLRWATDDLPRHWRRTVKAASLLPAWGQRHLSILRRCRSKTGTAKLTAGSSAYWISLPSLKTDTPPALLSQTISPTAFLLNTFTLDDVISSKKKKAFWTSLYLMNTSDNENKELCFCQHMRISRSFVFNAVGLL